MRTKQFTVRVAKVAQYVEEFKLNHGFENIKKYKGANRTTLLNTVDKLMNLNDGQRNELDDTHVKIMLAKAINDFGLFTVDFVLSNRVVVAGMYQQLGKDGKLIKAPIYNDFPDGQYVKAAIGTFREARRTRGFSVYDHGQKLDIDGRGKSLDYFTDYFRQINDVEFFESQLAILASGFDGFGIITGRISKEESRLNLTAIDFDTTTDKEEAIEIERVFADNVIVQTSSLTAKIRNNKFKRHYFVPYVEDLSNNIGGKFIVNDRELKFDIRNDRGFIAIALNKDGQPYYGQLQGSFAKDNRYNFELDNTINGSDEFFNVVTFKKSKNSKNDSAIRTSKVASGEIKSTDEGFFKELLSDILVNGQPDQEYLTNQREITFYNLAILLRSNGYSEEDALTELVYLNDKLDDKLDIDELENSALKSAYSNSNLGIDKDHLMSLADAFQVEYKSKSNEGYETKKRDDRERDHDSEILFDTYLALKQATNWIAEGETLWTSKESMIDEIYAQTSIHPGRERMSWSKFSKVMSKVDKFANFSNEEAMFYLKQKIVYFKENRDSKIFKDGELDLAIALLTKIKTVIVDEHDSSYLKKLSRALDQFMDNHTNKTKLMVDNKTVFAHIDLDWFANNTDLVRYMNFQAFAFFFENIDINSVRGASVSKLAENGRRGGYEITLRASQQKRTAELNDVYMKIVTESRGRILETATLEQELVTLTMADNLVSAFGHEIDSEKIVAFSDLQTSDNGKSGPRDLAA